MRFSWRYKTAKINSLIFHGNSCSPLSVNWANAKKSRGIVFLRFSAILAVNLCWCIAQITKSVVASIAVKMINIFFRPFSSHVKPCKAMEKIRFAVNNHIPIFPGRVIIPRHLSGAPSSAPGIGFARKNPRFWIVVQELLKPLLGKRRIAFAHLSFLVNDNLGSDATGFPPCSVAKV
jgi:hypothetical protein